MTTSLRTITHVEAGVTKDQWELTLDCGHTFTGLALRRPRRSRKILCSACAIEQAPKPKIYDPGPPPYSCTRCKDPDGRHPLETCVANLGEANDRLNSRIKDIEVRLDRMINRHSLDDSEYGRDA